MLPAEAFANKEELAAVADDNVTNSTIADHHRAPLKHTTHLRKHRCGSYFDGSSYTVKIDKTRLIYYCIISIIFIMTTVDRLRTFIINERALLTQMGRERYRTRRRVLRKSRFCDETDEPKPWQLFSGWRSLSTCEEFDLSLRKNKLGDNGVKRLMNLLGRKEYANGKRRGKLRLLNLQRQGITRRGAGYISRWLSADPLEVDNAKITARYVVDVDRIPTAASTSIFINLEGNPIGLLGFKDLERAVDKARINGIKVVIVGGGSGTADGKLETQHVVKVGPVTYHKTQVTMKPWRLPVPLIEKILGSDRPFIRMVKVVVVFCLGFTAGRATSMVRLPYRLAILRNDV